MAYMKDVTGRRLDDMILAGDGTPTTVRTAGDGLIGRFDFGHAGDNYVQHLRAEVGSSGYVTAYGLDNGAAGGILVAAKSSGPGLWVSSNPSHSGAGVRIQGMSKQGNIPLQVDIFEGSQPARFTAQRGAGYYDGVANGTTTFTSATASFAAGDVGQTLTQLTSRGEGFLIPTGTTIVSRTNATTVVLSAAATGSGTGINFMVGNRPPADGSAILEILNNDGTPTARFRNKTPDDWYKAISFVAATGSNQHQTRRAFDGTRFYRYFAGGSTYNINAILASNTGTVQMIGYDNNVTPGSETGGAVVIEYSKNALGFYGATPAAKPSGVAVTAAGVHAALVTLGLIGA